MTLSTLSHFLDFEIPIAVPIWTPMVIGSPAIVARILLSCTSGVMGTGTSLHLGVAELSFGCLSGDSLLSGVNWERKGRRKKRGR